MEPSDLKKVVNLSYNFDRLCEHVKKLKDEFARVSPYLISDVMEAFQQETLYPNVRTNVLHGVHKLLDICDSHSIEYLSSVLPSGKQEIFKHLFSNYKQYYKYAGRVWINGTLSYDEIRKGFLTRRYALSIYHVLPSAERFEKGTLNSAAIYVQCVV